MVECDGMNRAAWRERYLAKNALSPTRKRVERLADLINAPVLETIIWCVEAGSGKHMTCADRSTAVFEMLLKQIWLSSSHMDRRQSPCSIT